MSELELRLDERTSIFVEVEEPPGRHPASNQAEKITSEFAKVTDALQSMAKAIRGKLTDFDGAPNKIEVEMGVDLKGEAHLYLVKGESSGHIKMKLTWERGGDDV